MRRLIVNADDFGLTDGINRAVAALHTAGSLDSATLMAASPRFAEAVALAKQCPSLGVGCHVVLVDGSPISDPSSISSLLNTSDSTSSTNPSFRRTLRRFVQDLFMGRISRADMEREATEQILRLQRAGLTVTHLDTHKHTHMFPAVLDAVTRAAKACGVRAIRNPFEPAWCVAATPNASQIRKLQVKVLGRLEKNFHSAVRRRGLTTTDGCLGILATGTLNEVALRSILSHIPDGTWELVCHPAYVDNELRRTHTRLQESRAVELATFELLPVMLAQSPSEIDRIHFGQLVS